MTAHIGATLESLMSQDSILGGAARDLGTNQEFIKQVVSHAHSSLEADVRRSIICLLYTSPSPRDKRQSRMPSSA